MRKADPESEFSRWIRHGRGAAYLFVERNPPGAYEADLLRHCVRHYWTDYLFERGRYLYAIIERTERAEVYRRHLIGTALGEKGFAHRDRQRQIELLEQFAAAGDAEARQALYTASKLRTFAPKRIRQAVGEAIARLDGLAGFLFMMREFRWRSEEQIVDLDLMLGASKEDVEALRTVVEGDARAQWLIGKLEEREREWQQCRKGARPAPDLEAAVRAVMESSDAGELRKSLPVFGKRKFPGPIDRLFELTRHADEIVAWRATIALEHFEHPDVRRLGEGLLSKVDWRKAGVYLLAGNPKQGDWAMLTELLNRERSEGRFHDMGSAVLHYAKKRATPDALELLTLLYERADCSYCRKGCVEILDAMGLQPDWMREEYAHDAYTMVE